MTERLILPGMPDELTGTLVIVGDRGTVELPVDELWQFSPDAMRDTPSDREGGDIWQL